MLERQNKNTNRETSTNTLSGFAFSHVQFLFFIIVSVTLGFFGVSFLKYDATAAAPQNVITYQGRLLESGVTVTSTKSMAFVLYDAATAGNELYTASGTLANTGTLSIIPTNGVFSVDLGATGTNAIDPSIFGDTEAVYLQVYVDGTALTPRKLIASAPSAINSRYLLGYSPDTNSTSQYIALSDEYGNFAFTGTPTSSDVSGGVLYINPASADADDTLFGIAVNGNERFRVDEDGDVSIAGSVNVTGTAIFNNGITVNPAIDPTPFTNADYNLDAIENYVAVGDLLFGSSGSLNKVAVYDLSEKDNIRKLDEITLDSPRFLTVVNDYIYAVSRANDSLYIIDATDPTNLSLVITHTITEGPLPLPTDARVPVAVGNYLYIVGFNAIDLYDISSPENPIYIKRIAESISAELQLNAPVKAKIYENLLIIGDQVEGVSLLDITNPENPVPLSNIDENDSADFNVVYDFAVRDEYLYVANGTNDGFGIFDISSTTNPQVVDTFTDGGDVSLDQTTALDIIGNYVYVASSDDRIVQIFDVTDPTNAVAVGQIVDGGAVNILTPRFIGWVDDSLVLGGLYDIQLFDLQAPNIAIANIGSASVEELKISGRSTIAGDLVVRGGINVGRAGLNVVGSAGFSVATSSLTATNTLSFSHTALFMATASSSNSNAFVFDTRNTLTDGNLLTVRNNGTARFVIDESGNVGINTSSPQYNLSVSGTTRITGDTIIDGSLTANTTTLNNTTLNNTTTFGAGSSIAGDVTFIGTTTLNNSVTINGFATNPQPLGFIDNGFAGNIGSVRDVVIDGNYAYLVAGTGQQLTILDVSSPSNITEVSILDTGTILLNPNDIAKQGDIIYVSSQAADGVVSVDVSNPADPKLLDTISNGGGVLLDNPEDITTQGNYLYVVTDGSDALQIIDISDPTNMVAVGSITNGTDGALLDNAGQITVHGEYAYVGSETAETLQVLDISDPNNIIVMDSVNNTLGPTEGIEYRTGYIYRSANDSGNFVLEIFNVQDPSSISQIGSTNLDASLSIGEFDIGGNYAYVPSLDDNIYIIDISDPTSPTTTATLVPSIGTELTDVSQVLIVGTRLYAASNIGSSLQIMDITGASIANSSLGNAEIDSLFVRGDSNVFGGLQISGGLEITGGSGLLIGGDTAFRAATTTLTATNTLAFSHTAYLISTATTTDDAFVLDTRNTITNGNLLSVRNNGTERFVIDESGNVGIGTSSPQYNLAVSGSLYVSGTTTFEQGIDLGSAINLDNANNRVGIGGTTSPQYNLAVSGTARITGDTQIDGSLTLVGNASNPVFVASTTLGAGFGGVTNPVMRDNYVYVPVYSDNRIDIIDVSDPANPVTANTVARAGNPLGAALVGNYLYVFVDTGDETYIYSLQDPSNPVEVAQFTGGGPEMKVSGNYLIGIGDDANLTAGGSVSGGIFDISIPTQPIEVSDLSGIANDFVFDIDIQNNLLFTASLVDGITIVDITDPKNPVELSTIDVTNNGDNITSPDDIEVRGETAYVVDSNGFFTVIDISDPANPTSTQTIDNGDNGIEINSLIPNGLQVVGDYAYLSSRNGLFTLDVSGLTATYIASSSYATGMIDSAIPARVLTDGSYLYVALVSQGALDTDELQIFDIQAGQITNANVGAANISQLRVSGETSFGNNIAIRGGLTAGSALFMGDISLSNMNTTTLATNTLYFSHTAHFLAGASTTEDYGYIFDTRNTFSNGNLISVRNNGTERFVIDESGNVGINSSTPNYSLTVGGDFFVAATATFGGAVDLGALSIDNVNNRIGINSSSPQYNLAVSGTSFLGGDTIVEGTQVVKGNPLTPTTTGFVTSTLLDDVYDVEVVGDYAYITSNQTSMFVVLDVSDVTNPTIIATSTTGLTRPRGLKVANNYAYIAEQFGNRLVIYDISNPSNPTFVNNIANGTDGASLFSPFDVDVQGNYAYVASNSSDSVQIIDISDPNNLVVLGSIISAGPITLNGPVSIVVRGDYAYIAADDSEAIQILDISDPNNPEAVSSYAMDFAALSDGLSDIEVEGKYAYVASDAGSYVAILDISDPTNVTSTAIIQHGENDALIFSVDTVSVAGDYLYTLSNLGFQAFDISDLSNIEAGIPIISLSTNAPITNSLGIDIRGNHAYIASGLSDGFTIVDVTGSRIANADIGSASVSNLQVRGRTQVDSNVVIRGGLNVGGGAVIAGDVSFTTLNSSSTIQNRLRFDRSVLFESSLVPTSTNAFVFNVINPLATTNSSTYLLSVRNNGSSAFSVSANGDIAASGTVYAANATIGTPGQPGDLAERVDIAPDDSPVPGDVMVVDSGDRDRYVRSTNAYATDVAGVISTKPSIVIGNGRTEYTAVMALIGRVPVNVSLENGAISHGDLLVTASTTGHAMRYDPEQDDNSRIVSVVGVALDSYDGPSSTGQIMSLIRTGWVNNRSQTIAQLQQELTTAAEVDGLSVNNPEGLNVQEQGQQIVSNNLNLNGYYIQNVGRIAGLDNKWQINEEGEFVTFVETPEGGTSLYALQSDNTEYVFSGNGELYEGEATIEFDAVQQALIDSDEPIKISVTLTDSANGIYVKKKNANGFTVKELNSGTSEATFDWVVIATKKTTTDVDEEEPVDEEPADDEEDNTPTTTPDVVTSTPDIVTSTPDVVATSTPAGDVPTSTPEVVEEPVEEPAEEVVEDPAPVEEPAEEPIEEEEVPVAEPEVVELEPEPEPVVEEPAEEPAAEPEVAVEDVVAEQ